MAEKTAISWTDATFNGWWGCSKVSLACDHCYAERDSKRFAAGRTLWGTDAARREFEDKHWQLPFRWAKTLPAKLGRRPRVFCSSMSDVLDKHEVAAKWRPLLWDTIEKTPELDWLLLTKRVGNAEAMMPARWFEPGGWPRHAWMGATVVTQEEADRDIIKLLRLPAPVRFVSIEPMLERVDLTAVHGVRFNAPFDVLNNRPHGYVRCVDHAPGYCLGNCSGRLPALSWVIAGGESGPHARPANPQWFRDLRDQCAAAGVPFHFKQWGEWASVSEVEGDGRHFTFADGRTVRRVGVDVAGRTLDGQVHDAFPEAA